MFVHVKCKHVCRPIPTLAPASSSERSCVLPPAPHVTCIHVGSSALIRSIRSTRFARPMSVLGGKTCAALKRQHVLNLMHKRPRLYEGTRVQ